MFNGKKKAITFSYDDGVVQDRRLVALLDKYGLKATFNLNSELFGTSEMIPGPNGPFEHKKIDCEEVRELYRNHEVAAHTLTHPRLTKLTDDEIIREVEEDRQNLSKLLGYEVVGMAYPCGGTNHDERVVRMIQEHTGIRYSRTVIGSGNFDVNQDVYRVRPTVHHLEENNKTYDTCKQFVEMQTDEPQLLYIWGHSYELDFEDGWAEIEKLFKLLSGREDIYYGTNREVFNHLIK